MRKHCPIIEVSSVMSVDYKIRYHDPKSFEPMFTYMIDVCAHPLKMNQCPRFLMGKKVFNSFSDLFSTIVGYTLETIIAPATWKEIFDEHVEEDQKVNAKYYSCAYAWFTCCQELFHAWVVASPDITSLVGERTHKKWVNAAQDLSDLIATLKRCKEEEDIEKVAATGISDEEWAKLVEAQKKDAETGGPLSDSTEVPKKNKKQRRKEMRAARFAKDPEAKEIENALKAPSVTISETLSIELAGATETCPWDKVVKQQSLFFMPASFVPEICEDGTTWKRCTKAALMNMKKENPKACRWAAERPGLFFDIGQLSEDGLARLANNHWIRTGSVAAYKRRANSKKQSTSPLFRVGSASANSDTAWNEIPEAGPEQYEACDLANFEYELGKLEQLYNEKGIRPKFNFVENWVVRLSQSNMPLPEAAFDKLFGLLNWTLKHCPESELLTKLNKTYYGFLTATCCNRKANETLVAYEARTERSREFYFGDSAEMVWIMYKNSPGASNRPSIVKSVLSHFNAVKKKGEAAAATYASKVSAEPVLEPSTEPALARVWLPKRVYIKAKSFLGFFSGPWVTPAPEKVEGEPEATSDDDDSKTAGPSSPVEDVPPKKGKGKGSTVRSWMHKARTYIDERIAIVRWAPNSVMTPLASFAVSKALWFVPVVGPPLAALGAITTGLMVGYVGAGLWKPSIGEKIFVRDKADRKRTLCSLASTIGLAAAIAIGCAPAVTILGSLTAAYAGQALFAHEGRSGDLFMSTILWPMRKGFGWLGRKLNFYESFE
jgi:hypothetical protein